MEHIVRSLLQHGIHGISAHPDVAEILDGVDFHTAGRALEPWSQSIWQVAWHMDAWARLKLDLFEDRQITWPQDNCFPPDSSPASPAVWEKFKSDFKELFVRMDGHIKGMDLTRRFKEWEGKSAAEMIGVMINHNSYHAAQVVALRRSLGVWQNV
jgi:uncharacterized damage-inducible protein DinB